VNPSTTPPKTEPVDEDMVEQANPGHGIPSQDPSAGAQVALSPEEAERKRLGLDKPIAAQFADYMVGLARFDLGNSLWTGQPVMKEIAIRFPVSLQVAIMATLIAILISVPLGILSAVYRDTWIDYVVRILAVSGLAIPSFWLGMLMIMALLAWKDWLPPIGYVSIFTDPVASLQTTLMPALSVGYRYAAIATRMMRSSLLEVLREDYIRTARAKGLFQSLVVRRHALRNALLPVVTVMPSSVTLVSGVTAEAGACSSRSRR